VEGGEGLFPRVLFPFVFVGGVAEVVMMTMREHGRDEDGERYDIND
jgi:hypothetical protein